MLRPTDSGCTPRSRRRATNAWAAPGEHGLAASAGLVEQRAVLGHDEIAAGELGKRPLQIRQLATGDQDQAAPGVLEPPDRRHGVGIDHAVLRERAVVVGGKGQKVQRLVSGGQREE